MMSVWAVLGAFMGAGAGLAGGGIVGAIGGMIGGMVELAVLGACFTLIGGRPAESVVGAVGGLLTGLAVGIVAKPAPVVLAACFGLAFGAITGATLRPYLRLLSLPVLLLGRFLRRPERPALIARSPIDLLSLDRAGRSLHRGPMVQRRGGSGNLSGHERASHPVVPGGLEAADLPWHGN
jgi:hypothetical protein